MASGTRGLRGGPAVSPVVMDREVVSAHVTIQNQPMGASSAWATWCSGRIAALPVKVGVTFGVHSGFVYW